MKGVSLNEFLEADDCAETGYSVELELQYPNKIKEKTKKHSFLSNMKKSKL